MGGGNPFATVCDSKYAWSPFVERSEQMMACWPRLSNVNVNSDVSGSGATSADELEKLANLQQRGAPSPTRSFRLRTASFSPSQ